MTKIISLFGKIIKEGSASNETKKLVIDAPNLINVGKGDVFDGLTCDFCVGDIFQCYFECEPCGSAVANNEFDPITICPGCYVEGRACRCGKMKPMQRASTQSLMNKHNHAVDIYQRYCDAVRYNDVLPARIGPKYVGIVLLTQDVIDLIMRLKVNSLN